MLPTSVDRCQNEGGREGGSDYIAAGIREKPLALACVRALMYLHMWMDAPGGLDARSPLLAEVYCQRPTWLARYRDGLKGGP